MIDLLGLHGADDANVVGNTAYVGKYAGNLLLRLAITGKGMLGRQTLEFFPLQLGNGLARRDGLGHDLSVKLGQLRLVVKRLEVGWPPRHVEIDDPFGLGNLMSRRHKPIAECILQRRRLGHRGSALLQKSRQCDRANTAGGFTEKLPPGLLQLKIVVVHEIHLSTPLVSCGLWFHGD